MKHTASLTGFFLTAFTSVAMAADELATSATSAVAEHGEAHGGGGGLPQFNPEWFPSQIFWLAVAFIVMYTAFSKMILPSLGGVIEGRKSHVSNMMEKAEKLTAEAKETYARYQKTMSEAGAQARQIMADADKAAKETANATTEAFRVKSEKLVKDAETSVVAAQKQALTDLQSTIADIARTASKQIANVDADQNAAQSAIAEVQKRAKAA